MQIDWLIKHNANVNIKDKEGLTPLHYLAIHSNYFGKVLSLLLMAGAQIDDEDYEGRTALFHCIDEWHLGLIRRECDLSVGDRAPLLSSHQDQTSTGGLKGYMRVCMLRERDYGLW